MRRRCRSIGNKSGTCDDNQKNQTAKRAPGSRAAAKECSPGRKPWVRKRQVKPRRGRKNPKCESISFSMRNTG
jgi:hypothetical protein